MADNVKVPVGACRCPGRPHRGGDAVYLHPTITVPMGIAAMYAIRRGAGEGMTEADLRGTLAEVYLHHAIVEWTFTDEAQEPIPVSPSAVDRLLPFAHGGMEVAVKADSIYSEDLLRPLVPATPTSSPAGQTDASTSASRTTGPKPPKPSRRSSPNGTAGKLSEVPVP